MPSSVLSPSSLGPDAGTPSLSSPGPIQRTAPAVLARALAAASERWLDSVEYRPSDRWTHLMAPSDAEALLHPSLHADLAHAQIWLLTWLPGQGTALHDHGPSAGAFAVVRGTLTEDVVAAGRHDQKVRVSGADLGAGRVRQFGSHYVHQVTNRRAEPAVSVHVYAPALRLMHTYDIEDGALIRIGTEKAGVDW